MYSNLTQGSLHKKFNICWDFRSFCVPALGLFILRQAIEPRTCLVLNSLKVRLEEENLYLGFGNLCFIKLRGTDTELYFLES